MRLVGGCLVLKEPKREAKAATEIDFFLLSLSLSLSLPACIGFIFESLQRCKLEFILFAFVRSLRLELRVVDWGLFDIYGI